MHPNRTLPVIGTKILPIIALLLIYSCSPKINEHFESNRYVRNFSYHIINDSLQLYFKSPADINYITDKEELKKTLKKEDFKLKDEVLAYGKTSLPPYEYYVTFSQEKPKDYPGKLVVLDTIIAGKTIQFIGNVLEPDSRLNLENDLKEIINSLEVGANYRKEISTVMDVVNKHSNSNKFFAILNEIRDFPTYDRQEGEAKFQMALTYSSFLGENEWYKNYLDQFESRYKINDSIAEIIAKNSETDSRALEKIINEAKKHQILMINENHFYPNHRMLVMELLKDLKDIGYSYFALEALNPKQDSLLNLENSYPTLETGFYTSEQNFSNLIRKAKDLGFVFVTYENHDPEKDRELSEAENLYNKTFENDPGAKVLVLAGLDHILEKPTSRGKVRMATLFKDNYDIDPLTVSQTHLNQYRSTTDATYTIVSGELFDNNSLNSVDYLVLNNRSEAPQTPNSTFPYTNKSDKDLQVSLYYGDEITNAYDYHKKVPYFTTILESGRKYDLPITTGSEVYLYTFDKSGKRVDKEIIQSQPDK